MSWFSVRSTRAALEEERRSLAFIRDNHAEYSRCMSDVYSWRDAHPAEDMEVTRVPLPSNISGCLASAAAYQRRIKAFINECPTGSACDARHGREVRELQSRRARFMAVAKPLLSPYELL
jgi:hypothetical protein